MTAEEIFEEVNKDAIFYQQSNGGVTLSGGEPTAQPDFAVDLLRLCRNAGIHTALDTCGYTPFHNLERILEHVDLVLYDFKHINPEQHKKGTGVSNEIILDNARKILHEIGKPLWARLTIIPEYNDSLDNIESTAAFIYEELDPSVKVHLLPYHRLGLNKHIQLERDGSESGIEPPEDEDMIRFQKIFESHGIEAVVGG
jgi:pyruvate formate lyase activating enzyme